MIKLFFDFIQFLNTLAPLFVALGVLTLLAVLLSKSIKRHATVYYTLFAIPFLMVAVPFVVRLFGAEMFSFNRIPLLGAILRDYIHAGTLGFPLLVIIMYMGALDMKRSWVKKLMSIRKELSVISGFPILTHALLRITHNFPNALRFFTDHEAYMAGGRVTNVLGAGISNFSFVLGVVMLTLFIPLWVTSFDFVRKRMGGVAWKKLQRWSYVLYALLFIHAMGIQVGGMLNPRGGSAARPTAATAAPATGATAGLVAENQSQQQRRTGRGDGDGARNNRHVALPADSGKHTGAGRPDKRTGRSEHNGERGNRNARQPVDSSDDHPETAKPAEPAHGGSNTAPPASGGNNAATASPAAGGGHQQSPGFADIQVGSQTRRYIHIASLLLIFGSYLYLRLRKASAGNRRSI